MKNKSTRLSRWKAAMCVAALSAGAVSVAQAQSGYAGPVVSPTSLDFATVNVGTTSAVQTLTVSIAYGGTIIEGTSFSVNSVVLPAGFIRSGGNCPIGPAPSPCTIGIAFQPGAAGPAAGSIQINASTSGLAGTTGVSVVGIASGTFRTVPTLSNLSLWMMLAAVGGFGLMYSRRR